ncbi:MAG TPA: hypothetical protein VGC76_20115 [Pyrinomonadaceae bacterium]|jgi:hypothetical protein
MADMTVDLEQNSKYRVAMDLAQAIHNAENFDGTQVTFVEHNKAREYWLTLYDQCLDIVKSRQVEMVINKVKSQRG